MKLNPSFDAWFIPHDQPWKLKGMEVCAEDVVYGWEELVQAAPQFGLHIMESKVDKFSRGGYL